MHVTFGRVDIKSNTNFVFSGHIAIESPPVGWGKAKNVRLPTEAELAPLWR